MPVSIFGKYEFDEKKWVVSLFNSDSSIKGKFSGHSVLLIEGQKKSKENGLFVNNFIRQCDILAATIEEETKKLSIENSTDEENEVNPVISIENVKKTLEKLHLKNVEGVIINIRIFQDYYKNQERYKNLSVRSWEISSEQGEKMLKSIFEDKVKTDKAHKGEEDYIPYQSAGNRVIFGKNDAHSCTTWCLEKLEEADIEIPKAPLDNLKTPPEKHVKENAEKIENRCVLQ